MLLWLGRVRGAEDGSDATGVALPSGACVHQFPTAYQGCLTWPPEVLLLSSLADQDKGGPAVTLVVRVTAIHCLSTTSPVLHLPFGNFDQTEGDSHWTDNSARPRRHKGRKAAGGRPHGQMVPCSALSPATAGIFHKCQTSNVTLAPCLLLNGK